MPTSVMWMTGQVLRIDGGMSVGKEGLELREIALDRVAVTRSRHLPELELETAQVLGTEKTLVVAQASRSELQASLFERGPDNVAASVFAWPGQAIVRLADGKVELVGDVVSSALGCLQDDGTVRPFATCRESFASNGKFLIE